MQDAFARLVVGQKTRPKRKPRKRNATAQQGLMTISRKEMVSTVKTVAQKDAVYGNISLAPTSFPFLKGLASSFERHRYNKFRAYWKPAVGTTYGGIIAMGIDLDASVEVPTDRETVLSHTPSSSFAVWTDTENRAITIPPARLNTRAWYLNAGANFDGSIGSLVYGASVKAESSVQTLGEIWVDYSITFDGTRKP